MQYVLLIRSDSVMQVESSRAVAIQPHNWGYRVVNGIDAQLTEYQDWVKKFYAAFTDHDAMLEMYFKLALHSQEREYELKMDGGNGQPTFKHIKSYELY